MEELGRDGITVNCICPGPITTGMTARIPDEQKAVYARRRTALGRYGRPEEVAHMTLSLCLPAASFLQVYAQDTCCANGLHGEKLFADLPLSTAARLSATFPVVSSATRVPPNNAGSNRVTAYQCVGEKLPHYRGRPLDLSWTVGLSEKAVGKREQ